MARKLCRVFYWSFVVVRSAIILHRERVYNADLAYFVVFRGNSSKLQLHLSIASSSYTQLYTDIYIIYVTYAVFVSTRKTLAFPAGSGGRSRHHRRPLDYPFSSSSVLLRSVCSILPRISIQISLSSYCAQTRMRCSFACCYYRAIFFVDFESSPSHKR